jgi:CRISPR-associated endonuclease/helicase Cas3
MQEPPMIEPILIQFWGKTPTKGSSVDHFHPALYHMIDVGCAAEALLRDGSPRFNDALLYTWKGCDADRLIEWLPLVVATHDLGKISAAFQGQAKQESTRQQRARLEEKGVRFPNKMPIDLYHAEISALWYHERVSQEHLEPGTTELHNLRWALRDSMGGHHGHFSDAIRTIRTKLEKCERGLDNPWDRWRDSAYLLLRELFAPRGTLADLGQPEQLRRASVALTGFIVWCDWIGSNEKDFPPCPQLSPTEYLVESRHRAAQALSSNGLNHKRNAATYTTYSDLFKGDPPRKLQQVIEALSPDDLRQPVLAVIEAPTGEGKTEAALALARRIAALQGTDEIFFALPTMASGNQMFTRLEDFYKRVAGTSVRLVHGQAQVVEEELREIAFASDADKDLLTDFNPALSGPNALKWFTGPKKAILAPLGVGTVDQVELGGLNVRHYMLRLFGFARKVVVIDEVHAYDAYMNTILDHTLEWLAAMGCSVVLLSATLPRARHRSLAEHFVKGLGSGDKPDFSHELLYPSLSFYRAHGQLRKTCEVFRGEQPYTMRVRFQSVVPDYRQEAMHLIELVREGGAVARICNRVDDAQGIYQALLDVLPETAQHILLHARLPLDSRKVREQKVTEIVGKNARRTVRDAIILVGTQVLEQSLDFDVDVMVTDFAPIDLLLQRTGRLHRHQRELRPTRHQNAVLEIVVPFAAESMPSWPRWEAIYSPYILCRTWDTLYGKGNTVREVSLPNDYRSFIEAVYGSADLPSPCDAKWKKYNKELEEMRGKARRLLTPLVTSPDAIIENYSGDFEEEDAPNVQGQFAKTRLGDRVTLIPVYSDGTVWALDSRLTDTINFDVLPPLNSQKEMNLKNLLARAIPVSDPRIVKFFRDENCPWQWKWNEKSPLLGSIYPLVLNHQGETTIDKRRLRLDETLGLIIEKEEV